jgi:hypothetical protein
MKRIFRGKGSRHRRPACFFISFFYTDTLDMSEITIIENMLLDASITDWASVSLTSSGWEHGTRKAFKRWLSLQEAGSHSAHFADTGVELKFLNRYLQG